MSNMTRRAFITPLGGTPPLPFAPPCNRQRPFFVAGDRQGFPLFNRRRFSSARGRRDGPAALGAASRNEKKAALTLDHSAGLMLVG